MAMQTICQIKRCPEKAVLRFKHKESGKRWDVCEGHGIVGLEHTDLYDKVEDKRPNILVVDMFTCPVCQQSGDNPCLTSTGKQAKSRHAKRVERESAQVVA